MVEQAGFITLAGLHLPAIRAVKLLAGDVRIEQVPTRIALQPIRVITFRITKLFRDIIYVTIIREVIKLN